MPLASPPRPRCTRAHPRHRCACSGDSRAVKGANQGGKVVALDLSNDHKPDLPEEKARILAAGGTVTPAGPDGRPSRMYANGHVGLAMSRSIGDGLCKDFGCIPDPEIQYFRLRLPPKAGPQGEEVDSFLIVASDGVWEFISSQEACESAPRHHAPGCPRGRAVHAARLLCTPPLTRRGPASAAVVAKFESASDAVEHLVNEACARWRQFEGCYRDDITAIIVYLPFLDGDDEPAATPASSAEPRVESTAAPFDEEETAPLYINQGGVHGQATPPPPPAAAPPRPSLAAAPAAAPRHSRRRRAPQPQCRARPRGRQRRATRRSRRRTIGHPRTSSSADCPWPGRR